MDRRRQERRLLAQLALLKSGPLNRIPDIRQEPGGVDLGDLLQKLGFILHAVKAVNDVMPSHAHGDKIGVWVGLAKLGHRLGGVFIRIGLGVAGQVGAEITGVHLGVHATPGRHLFVDIRILGVFFDPGCLQIAFDNFIGDFRPGVTGIGLVDPADAGAIREGIRESLNDRRWC